MPDDAQRPVEDDFFLMANLRPHATGLPFVVWISERGAAHHDIRLKVADGPRAPPFKASVALRPEVRVTDGALSAAELAALSAWVALNLEVLVRYWDQELDTAEALAALRPLPPA